MRIAHLTSVHSRNDTRILVKECVSLVSAGHDVILFVADGKGDEINIGVRIVDVGLRAKNRFLRMTCTAGRILKSVRDYHPDVIHFHDPELIFVALCLKCEGLRVVYDVHEDVPRQMLAKHWIPPLARPWASKAMERLEAFAARRFDAVVAATPVIRKRFDRIGARAIDVCNYPIPDELTRDVGWQTRGFNACYLGSISRTRGIKSILVALPESGARLNLAGAWAEPGLQEEMQRLPGWAQVNDLGNLSRDAVANVLAESRVGLVTLLPTPSYVVALPVKLFEYMAAGIPVIASDFPLWRSIVEDADCGLLVDPENPQAIAQAIRQLLFDDELAQRLGANGQRAIFQKYNWSRESDKLISLHEEILQSKYRV